MDKKKPSIEDILAMARKQGASGGKPQEKGTADADTSEATTSEATTAKPAAESAASQPAAPAKPAPAKPAAAAGGKASVADILAAARGQKAAAPAPAAAEAKPKPAPKPKPAAKEAEVAEEAGAPRSTASILEAARGESKRGPKSKAEAGVAVSEKPAVEEGPLKAKAKGAAPPMPPKPDYAKKPPVRAGAARAGGKPATEERRGVLFMLGVMVGTALGVGFTSLAATLSMWTLGLARFMFPNIITEPPSRFKVGLPADFPFGQVSEKFKASSGVWIVNGEYNGQREIYALSTICTHLGCTPNWLEAEQKFKCPCHGSGFYKDGVNFEGPAPRPLERYAIRLAEDGQLEVDKSRKFQEEKGEWTSPDCFVPA
jgi:cytochrome b6-f complex iron-sulfur subunit